MFTRQLSSAVGCRGNARRITGCGYCTTLELYHSNQPVWSLPRTLSVHCGSRVAQSLCEHVLHVISGLGLSRHLLCAVGQSLRLPSCLTVQRGRRCSRSASAASSSASGEPAPAVPTAQALAGPGRRAHSSAAMLQPSGGSSATLLQPALDSDLQPVLAGVGAGSRGQSGSYPLSTSFPGELAQESSTEIAQSVSDGAGSQVSSCSPFPPDCDSLIKRQAPDLAACAGWCRGRTPRVGGQPALLITAALQPAVICGTERL